MESAVTSDDQGRFRFDWVTPGVYFLLYDSGVTDFDAGLQRWGGQTLKLGNSEWLMDEYFVSDAEGQVSFHIPGGTPLSGFNVAAYALLTLLLDNSPFILAHDIEKTFSDKTLKLVVVDVTEGQTSQIEFQVMYFGD